MTLDTDTLDLSALTDDGDTLDLEDGRTLRLKVEPDPHIDPFSEYDTYGKVGASERDRNTGRLRRPRDFDGNAEKISTMHDVIWWQPPADVPRSSETFEQLRRIVIDLASFGMMGYVLELCEGVDAYDRPIVVDVASLWGVEPFAESEYVASIVRDLAAEVLSEPHCNHGRITIGSKR